LGATGIPDILIKKQERTAKKPRMRVEWNELELLSGETINLSEKFIDPGSGKQIIVTVSRSADKSEVEEKNETRYTGRVGH
jgi:hypothetical protein